MRYRRIVQVLFACALLAAVSRPLKALHGCEFGYCWNDSALATVYCGEDPYGQGAWAMCLDDCENGYPGTTGEPDGCEPADTLWCYCHY